MVKIIFGMLFVTSTVFSLDWVKDLDTAFDMAKKENKTVMVFVEGENCRWCKKMKGRTLSDETVEKRLEKFIVVKVMRENPKVVAALPTIQGVPTTFFMDKNKKVYETVLGFFNVEDFISYINDVEKVAK